MTLLQRVIQKFKHAYDGLKDVLSRDTSVQLQFILGLIALIFFAFFKLSITDWVLVLLAIGLVISSEIVNSTIELLTDYIQPEKHPMIKRIKDMSAAAVLISAMIALVVALLMLVKYGGIL